MSKKEEILAKSRNENKDKDLFEREIQVKAGNIGACTAAILATVFFVTQILTGGGMNYSLYAILFSIPATGYIIKAIHMKRRREIVCAAIHTIVTLIFSFAHIYTLISASPIL